jgi:hypothetical protein
MGKVTANFPERFTFPLTTSAIALPASHPGCHASKMASGQLRQLSVSITPPIFKTTITFLF